MASKRSPAYELGDFVAECKEESKAYVSKGALKTAQRDFGLPTQKAVRDFIANGGLENPSHANTAPRENENEPAKSTPVFVDSYNFYSGLKYGYIAFFRRDPSSKWVIKSFKANEQRDPRNLPFAALKHFKLGDDRDGG